MHVSMLLHRHEASRLSLLAELITVKSLYRGSIVPLRNTVYCGSSADNATPTCVAIVVKT